MHRSDRSRWSRRGEAPTEYEIALLQRVTEAQPVTDVWAIIAGRIGVQAMAVVLDELGGERVNVPTRAGYFRRLHAPLLAQRAQELAQTMPVGEVAKVLGVSRRWAYRLVKSQ